jgi:hypothetical protein
MTQPAALYVDEATWRRVRPIWIAYVLEQVELWALTNPESEDIQSLVAWSAKEAEKLQELS